MTVLIISIPTNPSARVWTLSLTSSPLTSLCRSALSLSLSIARVHFGTDFTPPCLLRMSRAMPRSILLHNNFLCGIYSSRNYRSELFSPPNSCRGFLVNHTRGIPSHITPGFGKPIQLILGTLNPVGKLPVQRRVAPSAAPRISSFKKSVLSHGAIAGIACGILALLLISIFVLFLIRRSHRNKAVLQPVVLVESASRRMVGEAITGKRAGGMAMHTNEAAGNAADAAQLRQRLMTQRIMTAQGELAALSVNGDTENGALRRQIEVLRHRIQTLESEQSQWALGLSEETPPGYHP
ncbi:hypothetical protein DFH06DRAFT_1324775 [Mycena polygramma]|nr:hypothetical protein DFH06DRAFT_1324775 [Mycena polygramma]